MKIRSLSRGIKVLLAAVGVLIVLCLVLVVVVVAVLDDDNYKALAIWGVAQMGDTRMVVDGDFRVAWAPHFSLTATGIRFETGPGGDPPNLKTLGRVHVRIDLLRLLRGILLVKDLEVADLQFAYRAGAREKDTPRAAPGWSPGFITPVVERMALSDLGFRIENPEADRAHAIVLRRLTLDDIDDQGPLFLQGGGRLNTKEFQIVGRMGGTLELYDRNRPFPIDLTFSIADLQARLKGSIDHPLEGRGFQLDLAVEEQELSNLVRIFRQDIPALGRFDFRAAIAGDIEALQIKDLDLEVSNGAGIKISAEGAVPNLATGRGTTVDIQQAIDNNSLLNWLFPEDWKVVEEFRLSAALRHTDGRYTIEGIDARVANDKGIVFKTDGALKLGNPIEESFVKAVDLNLQITSPDTAGIKPLLTDAIPEIGGVQAKARLVGPIDHLALEDLVVERGGSGPVQHTTRGRIGRIPLEEDEPLEDMDFTVGIQAENSRILREFYEIPLGELGTVDLKGRITGSSRRFKLQDVELKTRTAEGLATHVTGGIDFAPRPEGGVIGDIGFKLQFSSPTLGIGEPLLGVQIMRPLGPISGGADVTGTTDALSFENIMVTGGRPERLYAEWQGRINSIPLTENSVTSGYETHGTLFAARSSDFAALFDIILPDVGPVRGSWRETDKNGVIGMADIRVAIGDGKRFDLQVDGRIDNIVDQNKYETFEEEQIEYAGVDFQFDLETADTHGIAKLIGLSLPDLGPVTGAWRLTGGESGLAIREARLKSLSADGLGITVTGEAPHIDVNEGGGLREVDMQIAARAPDARTLPGLEAGDLPDLGTLEAAARLRNRDGRLNLEAIRIRTGPTGQPTLKIDGTLTAIDDPERLHMAAAFQTGLRPWLAKLRDQAPASNPQLEGRLELAPRSDRLQIDHFNLSARDWGGLNVEGAGTVALAEEKPKIDLQLQTRIDDPAAWGAMIGLPLPGLASTRLTGWYRESEGLHEFSGDVRLGDSRLQADFHGAVREDKPVIEATLSAQTLRLQDLGFYPEAEDVAGPEDAAVEAKTDVPVFSPAPLPLSMLDEVDLTLKLLADRIEARDDVFKNVGLDVVVHNGRLEVGPTTVHYLNGTSEISAFVDKRESPPVMALNMVVEDADLAEVLTSVDRPLVLGGHLNLFVDLHSSGYSAREMAANLQGETSFVIENGRIQRRVELLASDALDFLFTGPARGQYTDLDCTAFRMLFQDGVGTIQVFLVETPGMRAQTFGHVDLGEETLALIINPRSKRRLLRRSSPVRIKGPLQNPSVSKVPAEEAAILAGQILVPVVALPARALGFLWSVISRDKPGDCFIPPDQGP